MDVENVETNGVKGTLDGSVSSVMRMQIFEVLREVWYWFYAVVSKICVITEVSSFDFYWHNSFMTHDAHYLYHYYNG